MQSRVVSLAVVASAALLFRAAPSFAIDYVTPACPLTSCVVMLPAIPNDVEEIDAGFEVFEGVPYYAKTPNLQVVVNAGAITITGTYVACDDCGGDMHPAAKGITVPLPHLAAGHYSIQLFLAPDPTYPDPPPYGITIAGEFDVAAGRGGSIVGVVEYYYPPFDHYFLTSNPAEIALLDAQQPPFQDWVRTGEGFNAFTPAGAPYSARVCRFFNDSFAPKSSHFYALEGLGCEATIANFPDWQMESVDAFRMNIPFSDGTCGDTTYFAPVYRLYNNGMGGAPNHRFTTSLATRQQMMDSGWVPEGSGAGVAMCSPK